MIDCLLHIITYSINVSPYIFYHNGGICSNIFNVISICVFICAAGQQYAICIYPHVVCVVMVGNRYRKCIISSIGHVCAVCRCDCIAGFTLRRRYIKHICFKPGVYKHIFIKHRRCIYRSSARLLCVPSYKGVPLFSGGLGSVIAAALPSKG